MNTMYIMILLFLLAGSSWSGALEEWDDLNVIQVNVEKPHADMLTFPDRKSALTFDRAKTPWIKMLNGDWKFHWSENPASRPVDFYKPDFDDDEWSTIPVPSNWQLHGHGTPIYTNIKYPFPGRPPGAPREYNPVGSYRSSFILPKDWSGRKTYIHFAGVSSAFYLWVNGEKVGYSEGSRTPAEFDITAYLKPGENHLAAESLPPLQVQDADEIIVSSPNLELRFDKSQALLSSMTYKEQAMIARGFTPDFWRALTDNDRPSVKKFADKEWAYTQLEEISAQVKTPVMVADHMLLIQIENWKGYVSSKPRTTIFGAIIQLHRKMVTVRIPVG